MATEHFAHQYSATLALHDFTKEQFIALAVEAVQELEWLISPVTGTGFTAYTGKSALVRNAEVTIVVEETTATITSVGTSPRSGGLGEKQRNEEVVDIFISTLLAVESKFTDEQLSQRYDHLMAQMAEIEQKATAHAETTLAIEPYLAESEADNTSGFIHLLTPTDGYRVTPILAIINVAVFILMAVTGSNILEPDIADLLLWGANARPVTLDGGWWRLVASCFLHIGIMHLLMNMYALLYIGMLLEPYLGTKRFTTAYLLAGIAGSTASLWWHEATVSAGASGAIFGMYGVFLALLTTDIVEKSMKNALLTSMLVFVGFNLVMGLQGGIDNAAHIGGLLCGLLMGYAYVPGLRNPADPKLQEGVMAISAAVILLVSSAVYHILPIVSPLVHTQSEIDQPTAAVAYQTLMNEFFKNEKIATDSYTLPSDSAERAIFLQEKRIDPVIANLALLDKLDSLELPAELLQYSATLRKYCTVRLQYNRNVILSLEETDEEKQRQLTAQIEQDERRLQEIATSLQPE